VEVFLPSTRWIGLDPTNNIAAGERHIACAVGRDYSDVPPSRGVYKGEAESQLAVGVSVRKARAAPAEPEFLRVSQSAPARTGPRRPSPSAFLQEQQRQQQQ
jgi:transglutaminase-like putative cysteine protease